MITYRLTTAIIGLVFALLILRAIRSDTLHVKHGPMWLGLTAIGVFFGFFPTVFDNIAHGLGVNYPPILALVLALCGMVVKILSNDMERSRQERDVRRLAQRVAILEKQLADAEQGSSRNISTEPQQSTQARQK